MSANNMGPHILINTSQQTSTSDTKTHTDVSTWNSAACAHLFQTGCFSFNFTSTDPFCMFIDRFAYSEMCFCSPRLNLCLSISKLFLSFCKIRLKLMVRCSGLHRNQSCKSQQRLLLITFKANMLTLIVMRKAILRKSVSSSSPSFCS